MIRNKKTITATSTETDNLVTYKKLGKGTLMIGGKLIKPGELFTAVKGSISQTFRDVIVEVTEEMDSTTLEKSEGSNPGDTLAVKTVKTNKSSKGGKELLTYVKVHIGNDLYDVFDSDGNKKTDIPISETEADAMISMLSESKV